MSESPPVTFQHGCGGSALHLSNSPWQEFPFWRIVQVEAGAAQYVCPGLHMDATHGDFLLLRPGPRRLLIREPCRLVYVPFSLDAGSPEHALIGEAPIVRFAGRGHDRLALEAAFLDTRRELTKEPSSRRAALQVRVMLWIFADDGLTDVGTNASTPESIREAALSLAAHPEQRVSVPQLAKAAGFSTAQFARLFRRAHGTSPARYAIEARIRAACRLLCDQGLSVKETAYSLNYPSPFAFSRQFKQERGCAPSKYSGRSDGRP